MSTNPYDDIYLSVDTEFNGPIPGPYSMLSVGAAALTVDRTVVGTFYANLLPLPGAGEDPETMTFWQENPDAYAGTQVDRQDPEAAMRSYRSFIENLPARPVFMGFPASVDFLFHHWYLIRFTGKDPCGFQGFDLKTYAAAMLKCPFRQSAKRNFPQRWFQGAPEHDHTALTDAIEQGFMGINMVREHLDMEPITTPYNLYASS